MLKLKNIGHVHDFIRVVDRCRGEVWLESVDGDRINLKSNLSQYIAIAALITNAGDKLNLYCSDKTDEARFYVLFSDNPDMEP